MRIKVVVIAVIALMVVISGMYLIIYIAANNALHLPRQAILKTPADYGLSYENIEFSTIESGLPSAFAPPVGFAISVTPTLVFKPDYKAWGPNTDLFTHDDLPGGMFETSVRYYNSPTKRTYLGGSLTYCGGVNLYESEKRVIGQTDILSSDPRLSGYFSDEYMTDNAVVANMDTHYQILPDKILAFAKHDLYYDIDEKKLRQGSALGLALNLPFEIELDIEAGIGWNAEREEDFAWSVQIALSRYFLR